MSTSGTTFFKPWKTTDRTELITQPATADNYKVMLIEAIDRLTSHYQVPLLHTIFYLKRLAHQVFPQGGAEMTCK